MTHMTADDRQWISYDETKPDAAGIYEWHHKHPKGFWQTFHAKMRMRGNGYGPDILSPDFDYWDGYRATVPAGFLWRTCTDADKALLAAKDGIVQINGLDLRNCPFCNTPPTIEASQCGYPGGGDGVIICAMPHHYNTWRVQRCCRLIGFNGFASPKDLAATWNANKEDS